MITKTATITIEVDFDPEVTDAESIANALDCVLTDGYDGICESEGLPEFHGFNVQHPRVPLLMKFVAVGEDDELSTRNFLGTIASRIKDDLEASS
jgi:hypothetical protein